MDLLKNISLEYDGISGTICEYSDSSKIKNDLENLRTGLESSDLEIIKYSISKINIWYKENIGNIINNDHVRNKDDHIKQSKLIDEFDKKIGTYINENNINILEASNLSKLEKTKMYIDHASVNSAYGDAIIKQSKSINQNVFKRINKSFNILCADLGLSRIKIGIVSQDESELTVIKFDILTRYNFFGEIGFHFFLDTIKDFCKGIKIEGVSVCFDGPLNYPEIEFKPSEYLSRMFGWNKNICYYREYLEDVFDKVSLFNDAVAFSFNALLLATGKLPSLCLDLGRGVGTCIISESQTKGKFEIQPYEQFEKYYWTKPVNYHNLNIHDIVGYDYFKWVKEHNSDWKFKKLKRNIH